MRLCLWVTFLSSSGPPGPLSSGETVPQTTETSPGQVCISRASPSATLSWGDGGALCEDSKEFHEEGVGGSAENKPTDVSDIGSLKGVGSILKAQRSFRRRE